MKATIYNGVKDISLEELPVPQPKAKDVVVKLVRSGICGTDVTAYKFGGQYVGIDEGSEFGHEMVGYVCERGSDVTEDIFTGMRVFVHPQYCSLKGAPQSVMAGAFSEYVLVEDAKIGYNLFELPDNVAYEEAAIIEPFCVGTRGANTADVKPGDVVVVYGAGTIGLCATAALLAKGLEDVVVVDIVDWRLDVAKKMGAITYNNSNGDLADFLMDKYGYDLIGYGTKAARVDAYIDAAGAPNIIPDTLKIANMKSRIVVVAMYKNGITVEPNDIMLSEAQIKGSCAYLHEDIYEVIDNLKNKRTKITEIITHRYKIDEVKEAFEMASDASQAIKVVVEFE